MLHVTGDTGEILPQLEPQMNPALELLQFAYQTYMGMDGAVIYLLQCVQTAL